MQSLTKIGECASYRELATNSLYIFPQCLASLSGIFSIIFLAYSFFIYGFRILFHHNAKVLMILLTTFCLLSSFNVTFVCLIQIFNALTYENDCDVVYYASFCSIFRRTALFGYFGITTTQFFQMIERLVATIFKEKYGSYLNWLGGFLVLLSVLSSLSATEWIFLEENPDEIQTHCLSYSSSPSIGNRTYLMFYGVLVVNVFSLIVLVIIYTINNKKEITNDLNNKYQQRENLIVLRSLFPMEIATSIFVSIYILISIIVRSFRDYMPLTSYKLFVINFFIFPYISLFLSITILITTKRENDRHFQKINESKYQNYRNDGTTYFSMYESQWASGNTNK